MLLVRPYLCLCPDPHADNSSGDQDDADDLYGRQAVMEEENRSQSSADDADTGPDGVAYAQRNSFYRMGEQEHADAHQDDRDYTGQQLGKAVAVFHADGPAHFT